jgi:hypothetical protein
MAWTTPRTWIPGEFVTASMMNTHLRDNLSYLFSTSKLATYAASLANVGPSVATEVTALSFTIPGGTMGDGDVVQVYLQALAKNNKGSTGSPLFKVNVGAGAQVTVGSGAVYNNDANEYAVPQSFAMQRQGNDVKVFNIFSPVSGIVSPGAIQESYSFSILQFQGGVSRGWGTSTPTNFTGDNLVSLKITLGVSDATFYYKPQIALVTHLKN